MPPFAPTRTRTRRSWLLLAGAAVYAAPVAVASAEPNEPVASASLTLDANSACATQAELIERVRARSPRVRFVVDGSGLAIRVQITQAASGAVVGEITLANPGTKPSLRHVPARSCREAVDAVALIIAVTLDPTSVDHGGSRTAENGGESSSNEVERSKADSGTTARLNTTEPSSSVSRAEAADRRKKDGLSTRARATIAGQIATEGVVGVAPGVMPALALFATAGIERRSVWSPALVLGVRHAWRSHVQAPGGSASFALDAATLDICPVRLRRGRIEVRPCGALLVGRLSAEGADTFNPAPESVRPFRVVGGAALVTANLVGLLQVSGRLAVGANLVRDSFEFNPTTFHQVPPLSAAASIGIGVGWQ